MSNRLFDPVSLLNENIEANATKRTPLPIGEGIAQITKMELKDGKAGPQAKNPGAPWARLDLTLEITDPEYLKLVGDGNQEKAITFYGVMLDMQNGAIAVGPDKNIKLGKLREAAGVNGQPLNMLLGQQIRFMMGQKPHPTEPDSILSEIIGVTKV